MVSNRLSGALLMAVFRRIACRIDVDVLLATLQVEIRRDDDNGQQQEQPS
jgi:hypothetical protein